MHPHRLAGFLLVFTLFTPPLLGKEWKSTVLYTIPDGELPLEVACSPDAEHIFVVTSSRGKSGFYLYCIQREKKALKWRVQITEASAIHKILGAATHILLWAPSRFYVYGIDRGEKFFTYRSDCLPFASGRSEIYTSEFDANSSSSKVYRVKFNKRDCSVQKKHVATIFGHITRLAVSRNKQYLYGVKETGFTFYAFAYDLARNRLTSKLSVGVPRTSMHTAICVSPDTVLVVSDPQKDKINHIVFPSIKLQSCYLSTDKGRFIITKRIRVDEESLIAPSLCYGKFVLYNYIAKEVVVYDWALNQIDKWRVSFRTVALPTAITFVERRGRWEAVRLEGQNVALYIFPH